VADAGDVQPGGDRVGGGLVAAGEPPPAAELGEAVLDLPQRADGLEALGLVRLAPALDGDGDLVSALDALDERLESEVGEDLLNSGQVG
jgi:hypothetical protein